mgnify:CR=1 FL=1
MDGWMDGWRMDALPHAMLDVDSSMTWSFVPESLVGSFKGGYGPCMCWRW